MTHKIEFVTTSEGDWQEIVLDGTTFASNHSLGAYDWLSLIKKLADVNVIEMELTEEEYYTWEKSRKDKREIL